MNDNKKNVLGQEIGNVVNETTSNNNLKSTDMVDEKVNATGVAKDEVANTIAENVNAAEDAASINQIPENMEKMEEKVGHPTRIAKINGEEITIVVAHTKYGMELPKDKKNLCGSIDHNKMLSCIYHLATPEIFWEAGIELLDEGNSPIGKDTGNVFVLCPTADTYWRIAVDGKLNSVEVHTFKSVEEYAQTIGCTNLYSRGLSNTEKVGVAALATGNEAAMAVFEFAQKHNIKLTTAQQYLDVTFKPSSTMAMTIGIMPKIIPSLGRSVKEAEELIEQTLLTFGENARKRYAIRAINSLIHTKGHSIEQMLCALKVIPASELGTIELAKCGEKESCISGTLTTYLEMLKSETGQEKLAA